MPLTTRGAAGRGAAAQNIFALAGEVAEVRLPTDDDGACKGFAFVRYASPAEAAVAVAELHRAEVCGKEVGVILSQENSTLFMSGVDKTWSQEQFVTVRPPPFPGARVTPTSARSPREEPHALRRRSHVMEARL
jgi:RNA recognition motif-containing protein